MSRGDRIRTCDPSVPNAVRYQLRYSPIQTLHSTRDCPVRQSMAWLSCTYDLTCKRYQHPVNRHVGFMMETD